MNRQIKFRVWDKINSCWTIYKGEDFVDINQEFLNPNYVFQQFTGLKDSQGKEIYEGDIVIYDKPQSNLFGITTICKWNKLMLCFEFVNEQENFVLGADRWGNIKVLGNIFENPNLLK